MANLSHYYRKSITRRFISMMLAAIMLILFGAIFVLWSMLNILNDFEAKTAEIREKQEIVTQIREHSNKIILHARGYYVFLTDFEYDEIFKGKRSLDMSLADSKKLNLSTSEKEIIQSMEDFFSKYFEQVLPRGIEFAERGDYESLRQLVSANHDNPVNELIRFSQSFENQVQQIAADENDRLIQNLSYQGALFIIYILFILVLSLFIARKIATDIGVPLGQLTKLASRFAYGELFQLEHLSREDEIGELSRSFNRMITQIQAKEEELLSQNEELQAQQDELQAQQEELQLALNQMEKNELYLEKRNQLVQSLANTLDQKELLQSIIRNIVDITDSDKGLIVRINAHHDYASIGVSTEAASQFIQSLDEGIVLRIAETKQPYRLTRECSAAEKGYHEGEMRASELILPILNANEDLVACLILTKLSRSISKQEELEIMGMTKQVSIAFDKLEMFEESEKQRQMTSDMLNTIQEGIQFVDLTGTTLQINGKMTEFFGLFQKDGDRIQISLAEFTALISAHVVEPDPLIRYVTSQIKSGNSHESSSMNYEIIEPNRRFIQIYCEPLFRDGVKFGFLLVHRDITKEYEVDRMKSEFVSTVSHELRTPLASVLGFAELLLHRELKPERQRKYVTTIHQEARRLTTLINDFLDLQRMESGKQTYEMKPISLIPLINEVIELQRINTTSHHISWHNEANQMNVTADRDKVQQVFTNLLSNAIKYSPNGGEIRVFSSLIGDKLVIRIEDEGLGIPEDAISKLFNKFYRVDNSDRREIGGTGLGLAIVKEIMTRHKGTIEVASEIGKGSVFTIAFPVTHLQERLIPESNLPETPHQGAAIHVMLIENDYNLANLLKDELQSSGFRVHLYTEGLGAIQDIERLNPDVVVTDLMLEPDITGWHIIEQMKKSKTLFNTPIVISSAFEEREKATRWGIKEFLVKPFLPGKLTAAILRILPRS